MKRFERIASVVTKQSRAQKTRTRLVRRLILILALTFFIFPVLTIQSGAQKVPLLALPQIQKQPPPPLPDLVPWAGEVSPNFCIFTFTDRPKGEKTGFSELDLFVYVKNQWSSGGYGGGDAPASMAKVEFKLYGGPDGVYWKALEFKPVPPLLKGERTQCLGTTCSTSPLRFKVPKGAFSPSDPQQHFAFIITVDSGNQVQETHESNNHVSASCCRWC